MTAKEKLLERAPHWTEEQALRALRAAERGGPESSPRAISEYSALLDRVAALRARQDTVVDAAALVREGRGDVRAAQHTARP